MVVELPVMEHCTSSFFMMATPSMTSFALIEFVCARYASSCHSLQLGTGEVPSTLAFYRACGFVPFDRIPDFFTRNYPQPIVEEGILLRDMVYLRRRLSAGG